MSKNNNEASGDHKLDQVFLIVDLFISFILSKYVENINK